MAKKAANEITRFGVGEWFGNVVSQVSAKRRAELAEKANLSFKAAAMPCPFKQSALGTDTICNKKGGVCSLVQYKKDEAGTIKTSGEFVTLCPNRFWQDASAFRWIGEHMLGTSKPIVISEIEFLESILGGDSAEKESEEDSHEKSEPVGRIDLVLMHPDNQKWCAVELQAVYFSGPGMPSHLRQFTDDLTALPWPDKTRRPDWRSSGPKRLMPQLMTKIPTLRRWGVRMAVVVDTGFYQSLGPMREVKHLSNSDITWFVVDYDPTSGSIKLSKTFQSTLEDSMEALTAGVPLAREQFEQKLQEVVQSIAAPMKKKVMRLT